MLSYVIITPAKNEEDYIRFTLDSIIEQNHLPKKWIIVDDSSTDKTCSIVTEYANRYSWISLITTNSQYKIRRGGPNVVKTFYNGFEQIREEFYDVIVKLDADLTLPQNYFEEICKAFNQNERLGICGGYILTQIGKTYKKETSADFHVRGAFKSLRKKCFEDIGGFKEIYAWDGIDELTAIYKGWEILNLKIPVIHHRPTTHLYSYNVKDQYKTGYEMAKLRYNIVITLIRAIRRIFRKPFFVGSIAYLYGYIVSRLSAGEKLVDEDFGKFLNNFQMKRLIGK